VCKVEARPNPLFQSRECLRESWRSPRVPGVACPDKEHEAAPLDSYTSPFVLRRKGFLQGIADEIVKSWYLVEYPRFEKQKITQTIKWEAEGIDALTHGRADEYPGDQYRNYQRVPPAFAEDPSSGLARILAAVRVTATQPHYESPQDMRPQPH
jgi:hypothetical protein